MGRIVAPYGVKGWIKVRPLTADPQALLSYKDWWLLPRTASAAWQGYKVVEGRQHGATLLVQLAGVDDREAAARWSGAEVGVPRDALPAVGEGEIYWADLEGLQVVNRQGFALGRIEMVEDFGAHPVLRVQDESGFTRLIPYVDAWVDGVDLVAGRVEVDWQPDY